MGLRAISVPMLLLVCWVLGLASSCASDEQQGSERPSEEGPPAAAAETTPEEARPAARESGETIAEPTDPPEGTTPATSSSDLAGLLAEEEDGGAGASDGYVAVTDGAGALSVEVPLGWDHATGEESETGEGGRSWSDFAGEGHKASITAAPTLDAWHTAGGVPGIYVVASKGLARGYTDEQLVASGPFDLSATCEPGARSDFERGPYTGRMQAWRNCEVGAAATFLTLSAAPAGRECVVLMQLAMYGEADVEVGQHMLDAFEVECAAAATYPLAAAADDEQQYAPEQYVGASESTPASDGPDRDCADFASQDEAQAALQADSSDPYNLDADDDGEACEDSLPEEATQDEYEYQYEDPDPSPEPSPDPARVPSRGDVDCSDFSSSAEAQPYLLPGDPHRLDADGDEQACDSLP